VIELAGVAKVFTSTRGTVEALAGVHLTIEDGEFVCLVGPSGCGKTTLLHLIAGLDHPDSGQVLVDGKEVDGPGPDRGVLFQEPALFPWLTVERNVEFGMQMQRWPRAQRRRRAREWLRRVGVAAFASAFVHELSGGMRQRASLARALALDPAILLMDEPFAALDVHSRARLHGELERIWLDTGKTIVFVTHDVGEAVRLGSRVIVLGRRPARVEREFSVDLPRPRHDGDSDVDRLRRAVVERIHRHAPDEETSAHRGDLPGSDHPVGADR
jgi:NitT/TauT family transport system ATP-binding protein